MTDILETVQNYWNGHSETALSQFKLINKNNTLKNNPNGSPVVSRIDVERCTDMYILNLVCVHTQEYYVQAYTTLDSSFSMASLRSCAASSWV